MSALGLTAEDWEDPAASEWGVWPDNVLAVNVFEAMGTQWNSAGYGVIGLKYENLPLIYRYVGVPRSEWSDTFDCVRVMEVEALKLMNKER